MNVFKMEEGVLSMSPQQAPGSTILSVPAESSNLSPVSSADLNYESTSDFNLAFFDGVVKKEEYEEHPPCIYGSELPMAIYSDTKSDFGPPPNYPNTNVQQPVVSSDSSCSPNSTVTLMYDQKPILTSSDQAVYSSNGHVKPDQSFTAADSNSAPTSKSFIPCKVCGDKASGYHYGVTSCEGCKGFFRRSIQKQIEYRCLREGKCLVIRLNRNRCQYCRFKKCLAVGMSRDSVRYGRVPKRSRDKHNEDLKEGIGQLADSTAAARELETKQLAIYDIILTISQAHHANCAYTEERTRGLIKKLAVFSLADINQQDGNGDNGLVDSREQQKIVMWQHFANFVTPAIKGVVEFAKRVPIFSDLTQDDQLILIKLGFIEIFFVQVSKMFNGVDNTLMFHDGSYVTRQQLHLMFDTEYVLSLINLMTSLNTLQLNDTEIGLLSAIILFMPDRNGIYDQKSIEQQQDKLSEALKMQVARNHMSDLHLFSNIMLKVPELRILGNKHSEHLQWFRSNWIKLTLPPLFAEIFDIPKTDDDDVFQ